MYYNAGAGYKEVTLKTMATMDLQFCMGASFFVGSILNRNFFVTPFSSDAYRPHNTGHNYIHTYIIVQELMNLRLCMEIGFLPRRISSLTLSVLS